MRCVPWLLLLLCFIELPVRAEMRVPAYLIRLPDKVESVFVAETAVARFHRFANVDGIVFEHQDDAYMSIGQNGVGKLRNGDRRTPLGIYFVTEQLDTSRMHEKYGITAFTLDYPNALDRRRHRSGDGIWVHGVDRRGGDRPPLDTDGCIALPNENLAALESQFLPNVTPVLVARALSWAPKSQVDGIRRELDAAVALWARSQESGDLYTHLTLYDPDFEHWGMDKTEWVAFTSQALATRSAPNIAISDLLLLADPSEDRVFLSRFEMVKTDATQRVVITKRLYWRRDAHGALRIIAEDSG
jgi:murein L,D-transpeptidase YafK